jgi:hypothetical protein
MKQVIGLAMAGAMGLIAAPAVLAAQAAGGVLNAAEVRSQIVGHSVALDGGGMTWFFRRDGGYDADDGRTGRSGRYTVQTDGRLCWTETTGVAGCFKYIRKGDTLTVRRADPGHDFELGTATTGPL